MTNTEKKFTNNDFNYYLKQFRIIRYYIRSYLENSALINKLNFEKIGTIAGSLFLVFIISFSLYSVIRKNQQRQIQQSANEVLEKSISSFTRNWHYNKSESSFSRSLIKDIEENKNTIFGSFSRLGKFVSSEPPVLLDENPSLLSQRLSILVSYKVMATFENGQAEMMFNLINQDNTPVINYINIDAVYNLYSAIDTSFETDFETEDTEELYDAEGSFNTDISSVNEKTESNDTENE